MRPLKQRSERVGEATGCDDESGSYKRFAAGHSGAPIVAARSGVADHKRRMRMESWISGCGEPPQYGGPKNKTLRKQLCMPSKTLKDMTRSCREKCRNDRSLL